MYFVKGYKLQKLFRCFWRNIVSTCLWQQCTGSSHHWLYHKTLLLSFNKVPFCKIEASKLVSLEWPGLPLQHLQSFTLIDIIRFRLVNTVQVGVKSDFLQDVIYKSNLPCARRGCDNASLQQQILHCLAAHEWAPPLASIVRCFGNWMLSQRHSWLVIRYSPRKSVYWCKNYR